MNQLPANLIKGTIGELLVQLRLLQYNVQASAPLKDSGNDLIAIRGDIFKAIQVKTTKDRPQIPLDRKYHILAYVRLKYDEDELLLDSSDVFLIKKEILERSDFNWKDLD